MFRFKIALRRENVLLIKDDMIQILGQ